MTQSHKIHGRKGGSSGAASTPRSPVEAPNTLRSKATARILDAIAEGEIVGLANGPKSIYLDRTPLQNSDNSYNFSGVVWEQRHGTPDQDWIRGFPAVETPQSVGVTVKAGAAFAVTRRINNLEANAVRVTVGLGSLFVQDTTSGDTNGSSVSFVVRIRRAAPISAWAEYPQTISGKTMSPYQESYRLPLDGDGPWDVQVERFTPDSTKATEQNTLNFDSFTELVDLALTYPRTALVGVQVDGELFGSNIPARAYDVKGWIVRVPTIYDAEDRVYNSNFWNGEFKRSWTDDPAWLYYHLLTHPSGAGLQDSQVDKWTLYEISRYCSERVPDGFGGVEPRFSANFVINSRTEAYGVINALASVFRGMCYWHTGAVSVVADMPRDPDVLVNQSDVIDGAFEYSGASLKSRHTVALISYLDKDNLYEQSVETVEDADGIQRYGWNPVEVNAFACTSRGQAHRLGKWLLDTEKTQSEALSYKASLNHINVTPGMVAAVADPDYAHVRNGGKVVGATRTSVTVDAPVTIEPGHIHRLMVTLPTGTVETRTVTLAPGTYRNLTVSPAYSVEPLVESSWILSSTAIAPRQFKILGIAEDDALEFSVSAILHDPTKYARVELGIQLERPPFTKFPNPGIIAPPSDVNVTREYISTPSGFTDALQVTWKASPDPYVRGYLLRYQKNLGAWTTLAENSTTTQTIYGEGPGAYVFHVFAVNFAGIQSVPAILAVDILNESPITLLRPTGLELEGQGANTVFGGRDPVFVWRATAIRGAYPIGEEPAAGAGYLDGIFRDFEVRVYNPANQLVFTDHTVETRYVFSFEKNFKTAGGPYRAFRFQVLMRDRWGNFSRPADLEVVNPAPAQPTNLAVLPGIGGVFIKFDRPADLDYAGTLVWMGTETGFEPDAVTLVYDGDSTYTFVQAPESSTRFIRVAAYDSFGRTQLNVSAEFRVLIGGVKAPDFLPPSVPTGLRLTTTSSQAPDGGYTYRLIAEWDANGEDDFLIYGLAISENSGNFVFYTANEPRHEWIVQAGSTYHVKLRAIDNLSNASVYSAEQTITIAGLGPAPTDPTGLTIVSSMRTVWLQWPQHPDRDWSYMEIWEGATDNRASAVHIHNASGTTFPRDGLEGGQVRYYWIRAVNRSLLKSTNFFPVSATGGVRAEVGKLTENDFPLLVVKDAFIDEIDARKIRAGTVISGEVLVDGSTSLKGIVAASGGDPVPRINSGLTKIDPGKILIAGNTTLADWKTGGDSTEINGNRIATGSIRANSLAIGNRQVEFIGLNFMVVKETNSVTWSQGLAVWTGNNNAHSSETIGAFSVQFAGSIIYIYWKPGFNGLASTIDPNIYADPGAIVLGSYIGGSSLYINYGMTIIDGDTIRAGTIHANRIQARTITANELSTGTLITNSAQIGQAVINEANIVSSATLDAYIRSLDAGKIRSGTIDAQFIQVGGNIPGRPAIDGAVTIWSQGGHRSIRYYDVVGTERVVIGQLSNVGNESTRPFDGLYVRGVDGREILTANGLGVNIVGTDNITSGAVSASMYTEAFQSSYTSVAGGMIHLLFNYGASVGGIHALPETGEPVLVFGATGNMRLVVQGLGAAAGSRAEFGMGLSGSGYHERTISRRLGFAKGHSFTLSVEWFNQNTQSWGAVASGFNSVTGSIMLVEYKR